MRIRPLTMAGVVLLSVAIAASVQCAESYHSEDNSRLITSFARDTIQTAVGSTLGVVPAWSVAAFFGNAGQTGPADPSTGDLPKETLLDQPSYLLLVCRESDGKIEVLSSYIVPGIVKPAYTLRFKPQIAQLLDGSGAVLTQAFYDVERKLRWDAPKEDGTNELTGGSIPAPEVVFTVRVPYSSQAAAIRLSSVVDPDLVKSEFSAAVPSGPPPIIEKGLETLLILPLAELPNPQEVQQ